MLPAPHFRQQDRRDAASAVGAQADGLAAVHAPGVTASTSSDWSLRQATPRPIGSTTATAAPYNAPRTPVFDDLDEVPPAPPNAPLISRRPRGTARKAPEVHVAVVPVAIPAVPGRRAVQLPEPLSLPPPTGSIGSVSSWPSAMLPLPSPPPDPAAPIGHHPRGADPCATAPWPHAAPWVHSAPSWTQTAPWSHHSDGGAMPPPPPPAPLPVPPLSAPTRAPRAGALCWCGCGAPAWPPAAQHASGGTRASTMRGAQSAAPPASINSYGRPTPASSVHDDHEHPHASSSRGAPDARKLFPPPFSPAAADEHAWAASPAYSAAAVPPGYASAPAPAGFWGPTLAPATAMPPSRKRARSPDAPRAAARPPPADGACMCAVCQLPPPRSVPAAAVPPAVAAPPASGARVAHGVIEFSTHP